MRTYIFYSRHCYRPLVQKTKMYVRYQPLKMLRVSGGSLVRLPCSQLRPLHTQRLLTVSLVLYIPWIPCDSFLVFIRRYRDSQDRNKFDESKLFLVSKQVQKAKMNVLSKQKKLSGCHPASHLSFDETWTLFTFLFSNSNFEATDKFKNSTTKKSLCF